MISLVFSIFFSMRTLKYILQCDVMTFFRTQNVFENILEYMQEILPTNSKTLVGEVGYGGKKGGRANFTGKRKNEDNLKRYISTAKVKTEDLLRPFDIKLNLYKDGCHRFCGF